MIAIGTILAATELAHARRVTVDTEEATGSALEAILRSADHLGARPLGSVTSHAVAECVDDVLLSTPRVA
jgi:hypothetical protein